MQHVVSVGIAPSDAYQAHMLPYLSSELGKVEGVVQRANHKRMTWLPHALAVRERADSMGRDSANALENQASSCCVGSIPTCR